MTEQHCGATVTTAPTPDQMQSEHLASGRSIDVMEGHLYVLDDGGRIVAAYAPGVWRTVRLDGAETPATSEVPRPSPSTA